MNPRNDRAECLLLIREQLGDLFDLGGQITRLEALALLGELFVGPVLADYGARQGSREGQVTQNMFLKEVTKFHGKILPNCLYAY